MIPDTLIFGTRSVLSAPFGLATGSRGQGVSSVGFRVFRVEGCRISEEESLVLDFPGCKAGQG